MSTWGASWGDTWADTWGAVETGGPGLGARRVQVPPDLIDAQRMRMISQDDLLMLIAGAVAAGLLH